MCGPASWRNLSATGRSTPDLTLDDFRIEATLQPDLSLSVVTRVKAKPGRAALPVLAFDIAHPMRISAALVDGKPAEVLQRDSMRSDLLRNVGNEMFLVVPPAPLRAAARNTSWSSGMKAK